MGQTITLAAPSPSWCSTGVYDFTNYSTLRQWLFVLTLADVAGDRGRPASAAVVRLVVR